jgi:D-serine deaminase-like pyridoxal phosphate-dependent protein
MQDIPFTSIDTPAVLLDLDKLEANIREMSRWAAEAGLKLRPHTKVHECPEIAKMQIEAGAIGLSIATLPVAENMAEAGIGDIMVVHPFYGQHKLEQFKRLLNRPNLKLSVVVDMIEQAEAISQVAQAVEKEVSVLLKIDTGGGRFGILPGEPAVNVAKRLRQVPANKLVGIYTHEAAMSKKTTAEVDRIAFETASVMTATARMLKSEGIPVQEIVIGASPTFRATCRYKKYFPEITEIHPGTMVIGDLSHMYSFSLSEDAVALTVLTTVLSTPASDRAIIDAGFKTLSRETLLALRWKPDCFRNGMPRYGLVKGRPDLWLGRLSAEVGVILLTDPKASVSIGDRLEIMPNNATVVISMHDEIYGVRKGAVERVIRVGRGLGN